MPSAVPVASNTNIVYYFNLQSVNHPGVEVAVEREQDIRRENGHEWGHDIHGQITRRESQPPAF